jgi:hypothetical protein
MFSQIKPIVDILLNGFKSIREFKSQFDREKSIEDMLRFYFLLKDCVDDGEALIMEAGSNPAAKLKSMTTDVVATTIARWDTTLRLQGIRLAALQDHLRGQDQLAMLNPTLERDLQEAIGSKMDQTVTLAGIGSALYIRCVVPPQRKRR